MKSLLAIIVTSQLLLTINTGYTAVMGNSSGGGGDAQELRVNEIRSDLLDWISRDGARPLVLPAGITYNDYVMKMYDILQAKKVVIGFVEQDDKEDAELQVIVDGVPKTCRGFISSKDSRPHILCNISRFDKTPEPEQYKLIHHEYAGLVNIENNEGASSDYFVSSQITSYLAPQTVLRLVVKNDNYFKVNAFDVSCKELQDDVHNYKAVDVVFKNIFHFNSQLIVFTDNDQCTGLEMTRTAVFKTLDTKNCNVGFYCQRMKDPKFPEPKLPRR